MTRIARHPVGGEAIVREVAGESRRNRLRLHRRAEGHVAIAWSLDGLRELQPVRLEPIGQRRAAQCEDGNVRRSEATAPAGTVIVALSTDCEQSHRTLSTSKFQVTAPTIGCRRRNGMDERAAGVLGDA